MNQTSKPQIVPRTSLLKKKNSLENSLESTNNNNIISDNNKIMIKPALPAKPVITTPSKKPSSSSNQQRQIPNDSSTIDSSTTTTNHVINNNPPDKTKLKTKVEDIAQTSSSSSSLPSMGTKTAWKKSNRIKFRLTNVDLNRLRLRKDFDDKNIDPSGNSNNLIYDIREDDEQIRKMNEICELLVAGGYFRARIKGLHNFDKIIGGMCWAIQMCNIDLDIDIFYQENLSIGQKIALTEKIVNVLQKMKCPFKLEPHQIQGMDCIHIYPAIQWLVKKSLETRQQMADYVRSYSSWQFDRTFNHHIDDQCSSSSLAVIINNNNENDELIDPIKHNLQRRFLHPNRNKLKDELIRVKTTLLEYGITGMDEQILSDLPNDTADDDNDYTDKTTKSESNENKNLLESMTKTNDKNRQIGNSTKISSSIVVKIVGEQSNEIKRLAEDYDRKKTLISTEDAEFIREESKLKMDISLRKKELQRLLENRNDEKLSTLKEKLKKLDEKSEQLKEFEMNENESEKSEKIQLTELLNVLRKQKSELKQHCREEKQRLEQQIEMIDKRQSNNDQRNNDRLKEIDQELTMYNERHTNVKKDLSSINKKLAIIQRKFDDIPNRTELAQYQKRFLELYNQLSAKHNETKKFYTLYNTLSDERMYLEKEFNLINSILENFQKASVSNLMIKNEFLMKFQQTIDSIIENKVKVEQRLQNEKEKRDQLLSKYTGLIDEQRLYFIAVKAFKEECKINEQLIVQLEKINKK
ncbi:Coiled-coil domain-containing protein 93 [Dermatophagoides pteronyssinus]|uniref:Coiled-coil domain-containing protein 93 n=1 Tax=Dermatophagoides pteronyssinus TaxID=6956 RepID=A0ABQ8JTI9_DERPT|nr:Coiled-coil domain-containing protein 93 [Dermatophagoides pteronyssinus]